MKRICKKASTLTLAALMLLGIMAGCGGSAPAQETKATQAPAATQAPQPTDAPQPTEEPTAEPETLVLSAAGAVLSGQGYDAEGELVDTAFDAEHGVVAHLGEGAQITYTVPEGKDGTYDVYLSIAKAPTPRGSTIVGFSVNDAPVYAIPTTFGTAEKDGSDLYDLGVFPMAFSLALKSGDELVITGLPGNEGMNRDTGKKVPQYPGIGDLTLYPAGTEVALGYDGVVPTAVAADPDDILSGLTIGWLGSSVTYGAAAKGYSMADAIDENHPATHAYKYAMSGTTFVNENASSYVARMYQIDPSIDFDLIVVQLSTNDASGKKPLGEISDSFDAKDFDDLTVAGAMETIIAYLRETWDCPIMFYTGTYFDSPEYAAMVDLLMELQEKWGFGVIDLWHDEEMTAVAQSDAVKELMGDVIHPFHKGYQEWWAPKFEQAISQYLTQN